MGRVMPREFLDGVGKYLRHAAPESQDTVIPAIKARAEELVDANQDMIIDAPSEGALAIGATVLAAFETLVPVFDGDRRQTILYLQHVMSAVLKRPYERSFEMLSQRKHALDKIEKVCRKEQGIYGAGWDFHFQRPTPELFEMNVRRASSATSSPATTKRSSPP